MGLVSGWHRRQTSRGTRIGAGCEIPEGGGRGLDLADRPWVDGMLGGCPITAPRC